MAYYLNIAHPWVDDTAGTLLVSSIFIPAIPETIAPFDSNLSSLKINGTLTNPEGIDSSDTFLETFKGLSRTIHHMLYLPLIQIHLYGSRFYSTILYLHHHDRFQSTCCKLNQPSPTILRLDL